MWKLIRLDGWEVYLPHSIITNMSKPSTFYYCAGSFSKTELVGCHSPLPLAGEVLCKLVKIFHSWILQGRGERDRLCGRMSSNCALSNRSRDEVVLKMPHCIKISKKFNSILKFGTSSNWSYFYVKQIYNAVAPTLPVRLLLSRFIELRGLGSLFYRYLVENFSSVGSKNPNQRPRASTGTPHKIQFVQPEPQKTISISLEDFPSNVFLFFCSFLEYVKRTTDKVTEIVFDLTNFI